MTRLPLQFVNALTEIGQRGSFPARWPAGLPTSEAQSLILCGAGPWADEARRHDRDALESLIKGLVLYCNRVKTNGGSVSPVIYLYSSFIERFPGDEPRLTKWVRLTTTNDYEPFGFSNHLGATSLAEYLRLRTEKDEADRAADRARYADKKRQFVEKATADLWNAVRRGHVPDAEALLLKGADWQMAVEGRGSLIEVAKLYRRRRMVEFLTKKGIP